MGTNTVTIPVGQATLLTDSAQGALTIINNTPGASTVWISGSQNNSIVAAVPVYGGTSTVWAPTGSVYAFVPSGSPVSVTYSDDITGWQPLAFAPTPPVDEWTLAATTLDLNGGQSVTETLTEVTPSGCTWGSGLIYSLSATASRDPMYGSSGSINATCAVSLVSTGSVPFTVNVGTLTDNVSNSPYNMSANGNAPAIPHLPYKVVATITASGGSSQSSYRVWTVSLTLAPTS